MPARTDPLREAAIAADYASGVPCETIAARHRVNRVVVARIARRNGVTTRAAGGQRAYAINEDAFAALTDDARYWIGFALADGCVHVRKYASVFTVTLARGDRAHLELLQAFLGTNRPIRDIVVKSSRGTKTEASTLTVSSRRIVGDLIRYGVTPRKSKTASVCPELADSPRFWAGVVDGDGSLSMAFNPANRQYIPRPVLSLCGTLAVCEAFANFIRTRFPEYEGQPRRSKSIWETRVGGIRAEELAAEMYANGPALARKREMSRAFTRSYTGHPTPVTFDWNSVTRESLVEAAERLGSWQLVADELGTTYCALRQQLPGRFGIKGRINTARTRTPV